MELTIYVKISWKLAAFLNAWYSLKIHLKDWIAVHHDEYSERIPKINTVTDKEALNI